MKESLLQIHERLAQLGYSLKSFSQEDEGGLYEVFQEVVDSGTQFSYESSSIQEFLGIRMEVIKMVASCIEN